MDSYLFCLQTILKIKNVKAIINPRPTSRPIAISSASGNPNVDVWWLLGASPEPKKKLTVHKNK